MLNLFFPRIPTVNDLTVGISTFAGAASGALINSRINHLVPKEYSQMILTLASFSALFLGAKMFKYGVINYDYCVSGFLLGLAGGISCYDLIKSPEKSTTLKLNK